MNIFEQYLCTRVNMFDIFCTVLQVYFIMSTILYTGEIA